MSSFAGYCTIKKRDYAQNNALINALHTSLAHRGPHGVGAWYCVENQVLLTHTYLHNSYSSVTHSYIPVLCDSENSVALSFDGQLYNYTALRTELQKQGCVFKTYTDGELVMHAYKVWGIACVKKFDGEFAFALFDICANDFYLVRDRIGTKPVYFSTQGDTLSFASEIKALWQMPWINKEINQKGLYHYLTYLVTPAPMTLYTGVYKLPSGFYMRLNCSRTMSFHEWYNPAEGCQMVLDTSKPYAHHMYQILVESVQKKIKSGDHAGVLLSDSLGSRVHVALMAQCRDKIDTFSVSFDDETYEHGWAHKIAKYYGTQHHELILSEREAFTFLEKMVYHQDEPLGDSACIPFYYGAQLAKSAGIDVLHMGIGLEEILSGTSKNNALVDVQSLWGTTQKYIPQSMRYAVSSVLGKLSKKNSAYVDVAHNWAANRPLSYNSAIIFCETLKQDIVTFKKDTDVFDSVVDAIYPHFPQGYDSYAVADYHRARLLRRVLNADECMQMAYIDIKNYIAELQLMWVDKMSMANSLSVRVPFLDYHAVEYALSIPMQSKYNNGILQSVLKKSAYPVTSVQAIRRKKIGAAVPIEQWLAKGAYFRPYLMDMLHTRNTVWHDLFDVDTLIDMVQTNRAADPMHAYQLWALQNVLSFGQRL